MKLVTLHLTDAARELEQLVKVLLLRGQLVGVL